MSKQSITMRHTTARRVVLVLLIICTSWPMITSARTTDASALITNSGPVALTPIHHASVVLTWNSQTIYVDPTGVAADYAGLPRPDLLLITHAHRDHLSADTLKTLPLAGATVVMPQSVAEEFPDVAVANRQILNNGQSVRYQGIAIKAVPMYNLPETPESRHPKGWGNGYVLTLGGKRIYISGDTEGTQEMRSLKHIDLALVCMNLSYTMGVVQAADAVLAFKPAIVYPYHYRGQDVERFKKLVNDGDPQIEVRLRDWYPD